MHQWGGLNMQMERAAFPEPSKSWSPGSSYRMRSPEKGMVRVVKCQVEVKQGVSLRKDPQSPKATFHS